MPKIILRFFLLFPLLLAGCAQTGNETEDFVFSDSLAEALKEAEKIQQGASEQMQQIGVNFTTNEMTLRFGSAVNPQLISNRSGTWAKSETTAGQLELEPFDARELDIDVDGTREKIIQEAEVAGLEANIDFLMIARPYDPFAEDPHAPNHSLSYLDLGTKPLLTYSALDASSVLPLNFEAMIDGQIPDFHFDATTFDGVHTQVLSLLEALEQPAKVQLANLNIQGYQPQVPATEANKSLRLSPGFDTNLLADDGAGDQITMSYDLGGFARVHVDAGDPRLAGYGISFQEIDAQAIDTAVSQAQANYVGDYPGLVHVSIHASSDAEGLDCEAGVAGDEATLVTFPMA